MKKYIYGICFLFTVLVTGQELKTKRIKEKVAAFPKTKRIYEVLKNDENLRHGIYQEFYKKTLVVDGTYHKGLKHGSWVYTDPTGAYLQRGSFKNGKEVGVWETSFLQGSSKEYYNNKGVLDSAFYYDENKRKISSYIYDQLTNSSVDIELYNNGFKKIKNKQDSILKTKILYPNGQLFHEQKEIKDKLIWVSDYYNKEGGVHRKSNFKNGEGALFTFYLRTDKEDMFIVKTEVFYKQGVPNGIYTKYNKEAKLIEQGTLLNGNRIDKWKIWLYKKKEFFYTKYKEKKKYLDSEKVKVYDDIPFAIIQNPTYLFGDYKKKNPEYAKSRFTKMVNKHVSLNLDLYKIRKYVTSDSGICRMSAMFKINRYGEVTDVKVRATSPIIAKELKLTLQKMATFVPASQNGKLVNLLFVQPVVFRLKKKKEKDPFADLNKRPRNF